MKIITAKVHVQPDKCDDFIAAYKWMQPLVLSDPGALLYSLHRSAENPSDFVFYEQYESEEAVGYHLSTEHFKKFAATIEPLFAAPGEIGHWVEVA
jgi:(4S)-4-hydroxy-5-phosphonooxypentane-2,3-dione isomerase